MPNTQQQIMMNGAGLIGNQIGQELGKALFGDPQEDAAQQAAAAHAAAEAQRRNAAMQEEASRRARVLQSEMIGGTGTGADLQLMDSRTTGLPLMTGNETAYFGAQPTKVALSRTSPTDADAQGTDADFAFQYFGSALSPDLTPSVPEASASDYINNVGNFIKNTGWNELKKEALKGEIFGEEAMGPYGLFVAIQGNISKLPDYIVAKIGAAARGDLPVEEGNGLTVQAINRIFDVNSSVNQAVRNGAIQTALKNTKNAVSEAISDQVERRSVQLTISFLPTTDEVKKGLAETGPEFAKDLTQAVKFWNVRPAGDE